jgi:NADPH:quinone reductase-like Zn-dependent oxidoreductase
MQIARVSGAGLVITVDVREEVLKVSKELGADVVIDAATDDAVAVIRELMGAMAPMWSLNVLAAAQSKDLQEARH